MSETIKLQALKRTETGSTAARRLRRAGWLPGVVKFRDGQVTNLKMNRHDFEQMLLQHRSEHLLASLTLEDDPASRMVLLREVQHHVLDGSPVHVDFGEVSMTEKMHSSIPIMLVGEPIGVKNQGGILEQQIFELEVSCLPNDLLESVEADVTALAVGDALTVGELKLDDRFDVLVEADDVVAIVSAPKLEAEPDEAEAEAEPEVIGKGSETVEES